VGFDLGVQSNRITESTGNVLESKESSQVVCYDVRQHTLQSKAKFSSPFLTQTRV